MNTTQTVDDWKIWIFGSFQKESGDTSAFCWFRNKFQWWRLPHSGTKWWIVLMLVLQPNQWILRHLRNLRLEKHEHQRHSHMWKSTSRISDTNVAMVERNVVKCICLRPISRQDNSTSWNLLDIEEEISSKLQFIYRIETFVYNKNQQKHIIPHKRVSWSVYFFQVFVHPPYLAYN